MSHSFSFFNNVLTPDSYLTEASLERLLVEMHDHFRRSPFVPGQFSTPAEGGPMTPVSITMSGSKDRVLKYLHERFAATDAPGADLIGNLIDYIEETPDTASAFSISLYASVNYSVPDAVPATGREVGI